MVDVRIVNSVLAAVQGTYEAVLQMQAQFGKPQAVKDITPKYNLVTIIGFLGNIEGNFVYAFNEETALKIVSKMMGMEYNTLDELSLSAIGELGNMTSGSIAMNLEKLGYKIDITPPTVVTGRDMKISAEGLIIKLPVSLFIPEDVEFHIAIRGGK
ncbi:putative inhibitor of MCP methylation, CheC [Fervidobacterium pennivorans DSM 9078]|jgi:chemotaxis protein CheX|uniref:Inhibitor of MCP methylation, CheC n=1 Tax=Fervidobacterium pennivorans (strain DSM 9078 / Ven5) TaxID=771875 RepID=H9UCA4_FERPD|nr:chemotaxis protein CheX [Fervidobacterium pennivorans]AFG35147.1 putative inhibitor of MCP methylation, CheC [Fervidobacterium pennivorans DSM 9078]QIV78463.1 chemotaxis protein CheX [Fervidobacterium pennivorans subsp. keratinolyticus]